ncbi:BZ3500_MvSof-1268-A1-R1_Chr1-3g01759 [Microbotryum saponariae]|uniref:BZ3500_MvSof-1268-A1-R1_Chr1-3g01759 protein n=1 Tax=Microbotryum saponariae TaxID=289078 RepID=A0A2X0L389_9BASI|nr:BZ3500_MvSof-1268-A1-R1_Chr1-3g01759 [Microbotryum saponariae]SCZ94541.1 BZ3501_MvSof-1269-A2-R1_Chr1-3g01361 [Microbotryum saponariae]
MNQYTNEDHYSDDDADAESEDLESIALFPAKASYHRSSEEMGSPNVVQRTYEKREKRSNKTMLVKAAAAMPWIVLAIMIISTGFRGYRRPRYCGAVYDLLDTQLYIKTAGKSFLDQESVKWGSYTIQVPGSGNWTAVAGKSFIIIIQCEPSIIGTGQCSPQYSVHLRSPVAETHQNHRHAASQAGVYDVWAIPESVGQPDCPDNEKHWTVGGSGQTPLYVAESRRSEVRDEFRACTTADYEGTAKGRWISLKHLNPRDSRKSWARTHFERDGHALNVRASVETIPSVKHVAYLGDSILRSSFCGHLYPTLHNGTYGNLCDWTTDCKTYQHSQKSFNYPLSTGIETSDRAHVRFSQYFLKDDWTDVLDGLSKDPEPVTYVIINVGLWFTMWDEKNYRWFINVLMERVVALVPPSTHIIWFSTSSCSSGIMCYGFFKRRPLRNHGILARRALATFKETHPLLRINFIDFYGLTDARPETSSDGRHWVKEDESASLLQSRPLVGDADDAMMEWA